jgi:hypothetical protein
MDQAGWHHEGSSKRPTAPRFRFLPRPPVVPKLLVGAALAWLGWEIVSNTAADNLAPSQPDAALAFVGDHPAALVQLAENELAAEPGDAPLAHSIADLAERAIRGDPLAEGALRVAAFAAELDGDMDRAERTMELAGSRSLRDLKVQAWLLNRQLAARNYAESLTHADAILRVWSGLSDTFLPVVAGLANDPDGRGPLVALLKNGPPWRRWFLDHLPALSPDPAGLYDMYSALKSGPYALTVEEFRPYLERLVEIGDYSLAYAMQVDFLPAERIAMLGLLNNGGFDHPVSGLPFDWMIGDVRGARTEIVVDENSNRALRVEFYNTRVPFRHVSQLLLLQPGTYKLQGEVKSAGLRNARGMQWTISCAEGRGQQLGATDRVADTMPWSSFEMSFDVPAGDGCRLQVIRLVLAARIASEQEAAGTIWYDSLRIEHDDGAAAASQPGQGNGGE